MAMFLLSLVWNEQPISLEIFMVDLEVGLASNNCSVTTNTGIR